MHKRQAFINLPITDLPKTVEFFRDLGFSFNEKFTDENAACMIIEDNIFAMLLTKKFFNSFTKKEICDSSKMTEVLLGISLGSREEVDRVVAKALALGAKEPRPAQDHGWMYARNFEDLDGHIWEFFAMNTEEMPEE